MNMIFVCVLFEEFDTKTSSNGLVDGKEARRNLFAEHFASVLHRTYIVELKGVDCMCAFVFSVLHINMIDE